MDIDNLHKKFRSDNSKIVDYFLLSNFWWSFSCFSMKSKTEKWPPKVRQKKKIYNLWDISFKFFVHVVYIQKLKHIKFGVKNSISFSSMEENIHHHLPSIFLQNPVNCIFMENTFWSISLVLLDLQTCTVPHFKGNFILKNFITCRKNLQQKIETV